MLILYSITYKTTIYFDDNADWTQSCLQKTLNTNIWYYIIHESIHLHGQHMRNLVCFETVLLIHIS